MLGRVHLLRGLAYERLGEPDHASREFREVVVGWQDADESLLTFVQQAQAGLARLRGAVETKSETAIDPPGSPGTSGIR
jgi:hypothetical protein